MNYAMLDWSRYETVLLDMDGTILDLAFDNFFWREMVPRHLARSLRQDPAATRIELFERYARKQGTLDWYCLDYWTAELGLDLRALKAASCHRIGFLPGAQAFLGALARLPVRRVLVTNAHHHTLQVKRDLAGLGRFFDVFVTAHDYGAPKESISFWLALREHLPFDPNSALFVDDSLPVLDAAAAFGIRDAIAISQPDSRAPPVHNGQHRAVPALERLGLV